MEKKLLEALNTGIQVLLFQIFTLISAWGINGGGWLPRDQKQGSWLTCVAWVRDNHSHADDVRGTVGEKENYLRHILEMGLEIFAERRKKVSKDSHAFGLSSWVSVGAIH